MVEVLGDLVDQLVAGDDALLVDDELDARVIELQRQIDRLQALQARQLSVWNARRVWASDGSKSAGHRLSRVTGLSLGDAKRVVHRARRLSTMALCMDSFLSGALSTSRVDLLVRTNQPEWVVAFCRDESVLLDMAQSLSFAGATRALGYWAQCADEDRSSCTAQRQVQSRSASAVRTFDGNVDLSALFDPVSGEIFLNEFERIETELFEADWAEGRARYGDDLTVEHLARTPSQRRCDALVEMAKRSAGSLNGSRIPKPLITVLVGYETLAGRICELASGTIIDPGQVLGLLDDALIERVVFDGPSRVIDVGHKREFTGALRRAIEVRDRHCQDPSGCEVRANRCDVDHTEPWTKSRATHQHNGQLLCPPHNRRKGSQSAGPAPPP